MKRHAALTSTFSYILDTCGTLTRQSLSKAHPERVKRLARGVLGAIGIALCFMPEAGSSIPTQPKQYVSYKEYALHLLNYDYVQYKCIAILYGKESAWNPDAKNGSHHGIPQGRSEYLATLDGYGQVRWGLDYIYHRYQTPCNALDHWKAHNWH